MTDRRGTRVGWRAVAVVAPAAAALFAGTTSWALRHDPAGGATASTPTVAEPDDAAAQDTGVRAATAADQQRLADLQRRLDALTAQGAAGCAPAPSGPASARPKPAVPAPPAHTTTGASGVRR